MTNCNYCTFDHICRDAERNKQHWETKDAPEGGVAVYVDGKFAAWFMELPERCCC